MIEGESLHCEVVLGPDGPCERWTGRGPGARDQLVQTVETLERLTGLAVPRVLATHMGDPTVVDLTWSGPTSLAETRPTNPRGALALIGAVALTVQAAHTRGVSHGALDATLVTLDPDGSPVVTGFGTGPTSVDGGPAADADAIGRLAELVVADLPRFPRKRVDRQATTALREMAAPRPHTLAELVSLAAGASAPVDPERRGPRRLGLIPAVLGAAAVVVVVATLAALGLGHHSPTPTTQPTAAALPSASTLSTSTTTTTIAAAPTTTVGACPPVEGAGADIDGDGCLDPVSVDGTLVTSAWASWEVGADGDLVVLGDWDCDGTATPAALRPSTGAVFVFDTWVDQIPVSIPPAAVSPGLTELRVDDPDGDGCHRLLGVDAAGTRHEIEGRG